MAGGAAIAAAISPLRHLDRGDIPSVAEFLQKHYKEMTPEDKEQVFDPDREMLSSVDTEWMHGSTIRHRLDGVEFVYGLNLSRCIGCRKCVHACVKENNQSRAPEIQYIRVLEMEKGSIDVETSITITNRPGTRSGQVLHAGAVSSVRQAALRQGLPGRSHLAGGGRHHRDRLRLVHRLPLLRSRLPVLGAAFQFLPNREIPEGRAESRHGLSFQPPAAARA